jgi:hypothetical protein
MDEVQNFFSSNFQILGPLGCHGWVVMPQNVKNKKKSLHPTVHTSTEVQRLNCGMDPLNFHLYILLLQCE